VTPWSLAGMARDAEARRRVVGGSAAWRSATEGRCSADADADADAECAVDADVDVDAESDVAVAGRAAVPLLPAGGTAPAAPARAALGAPAEADGVTPDPEVGEGARAAEGAGDPWAGRCGNRAPLAGAGSRLRVAGEIGSGAAMLDGSGAGRLSADGSRRAVRANRLTRNGFPDVACSDGVSAGGVSAAASAPIALGSSGDPASQLRRILVGPVATSVCADQSTLP